MSRLSHFCSLCLVLASLVLPVSGVAAQGQDSDVRFVVETPQYTLDSQGLRVPGYAPNDIPGAPQLPVWTTVVEVPAGADWSVIEVGADEQILVAPAPLPAAPVTKLHLEGPLSEFSPEAIADALALEDDPDRAIYGASRLYPSQVVQAGPEGTAGEKHLLPIRVYPFQYNPVTGAIHYRPRIEFSIHFTQGQASPAGAASIIAPAPPGNAGAPGLLIRTGERGLYRLTGAALSAAGVPVASVSPDQLAMWYAGQPVDIEVTGSEDGKFDGSDAVLFYAEPYEGRYMKQNVYRLTWSGGAGGRVSSRTGTPSLTAPPVTTIRQRARVEKDRSYYSTYSDLARDADHLFDNPLYPNASAPTAAVTYTLTLENASPDGDAEIRVGVHGGQNLTDRTPDQSLRLRLNGTSFGPYQWEGSVTHIVTQTIPAAGLVAGDNQLALEASLTQLPGIAYYWVSPDWAEIVYPAKAYASNNRRYVEAVIGLDEEPAPVTPHRLYLPLVVKNSPQTQAAALQGAGGKDVAVGGFTTPGIRVYDVGNARHPVLLTGVVETGGAGRYTVTFAGAAAESYYLAAEAGFLTPASLQLDSPSTLASPANTADYIAIVHRSLWDAAQPLLDHRAAEGLRVAKVDVQDIYDEFSGSRVDPEAIRAFLAYAYHSWNAGGDRPRYVLLVGDGHYDFKGSVRPDLPNLIPPYLLAIDPTIGETAADNRFVSVDSDADFLPEMAIGRIPAKTPADVTAAVDKILAYETRAAPGAWQQRAVFVADTKDDPVYHFHALSDATRTTLPPLYQTQTIYYDKSSANLNTPAKMKAAIKSAFDGGALYLQWFGHASRTFWGKDKPWELSDPPKLAENSVWPFTANYSCWTGYFINLQASPQYGNSEQVLAETTLLTPKKGSLVDFAPTGLHVGSDLVELDQLLANAIFTQRIDRAGPGRRRGQARLFRQDRLLPRPHRHTAAVWRPGDAPQAALKVDAQRRGNHRANLDGVRLPRLCLPESRAKLALRAQLGRRGRRWCQNAALLRRRPEIRLPRRWRPVTVPHTLGVSAVALVGQHGRILHRVDQLAAGIEQPDRPALVVQDQTRLPLEQDQVPLRRNDPVPPKTVDLRQAPAWHFYQPSREV